jgi:hypothetical protein
MKLLTLKDFKIKVAGKEVDFSYAELIKGIVNFSGERGYTVEEMSKRLRVVDVIEAAKDNVARFEDADFAYLNSLVPNYPWLFSDKAIVTMCDDIKNMKEETKETLKK